VPAVSHPLRPSSAAGAHHRALPSSWRGAGSALVLLCALWSTTAAAAAAAPAASVSTALFPTGGSASAEQRTALDAALRKALEADDDVTLLSASETAGNVKFMAEGGALCTPSDLGCLQKFGLIATVDRLVVAEARGRRTLDVTLSVVDVASGEIVHSADAALTPRDAAAVAALVRRALHGDDGDKPHVSATTTEPSTTPPPAELDGPVVDETELHGLQLAGAWTAGIGGGVGALGLLGALGGEAVFWTGSGTKEVRGGIVRPFSQAMWFVAIAGAAAAGAGAGLYFAGPPAAPARLDP